MSTPTSAEAMALEHLGQGSQATSCPSCRDAIATLRAALAELQELRRYDARDPKVQARCLEAYAADMRTGLIWRSGFPEMLENDADAIRTGAREPLNLEESE